MSPGNLDQFLLELETERDDGIEVVRPYDENTFVTLQISFTYLESI